MVGVLDAEIHRVDRADPELALGIHVAIGLLVVVQDLMQRAEDQLTGRPERSDRCWRS